MDLQEKQVVELHFPFTADMLPSDHGYQLYSAICNRIKEAHAAEWLGIHSIQGRRIDKGVIKPGRFSKLRLRLPLDKVPTMYALAGSSIAVGEHHLRCGVPELHMLSASENLRARLVIIKVKGSEGSSAECESFLEAAEKQVMALSSSASVKLEPDFNGTYARRVLKIKDSVLTGYGLVVTNLREEESIKLQEKGIGGRRRMGCGLFVPIQGEN
mgnify:CR=1 FL=1